MNDREIVAHVLAVDLLNGGHGPAIEMARHTLGVIEAAGYVIVERRRFERLLEYAQHMQMHGQPGDLDFLEEVQS
jgi:hypothetical protein